MRRRKPRAKSDRQKIVDQVDKIIGNQIKERDGWECVRCFSKKQLTASHILPKGSYPRLRFEPLNLLTMCVGCHLFWWHKNPGAAREWLDARFPMRYDQLQVLAATARKVDAKELLIVLQHEAMNHR
jgi:5-methylcytosine-specific restriction endonuclease McrA